MPDPGRWVLEWRLEGGGKQPYRIVRPDGGPFAIAGLWDRWGGPDGKTVESCCLITTSANETLRQVHDRMPAVLAPEDFARWLDPASQPADLEAHLQPAPDELLTFYPVSRLVNSARTDSPQCIEPLAV